ncbi:hypothetical protein LWI29_012974 [Acer saccharum]|uniref:Uncharacterized protein n=1 Tax=Acer saccharum TaxID=4024 RepID=A0AA39UI15_ACESA|nr:hypothetical protein LWI29_012974 [Acer saccharum]
MILNTFTFSFSEWPLTAIGIETKLTFPHSAETAEIILVNSFIGSFLSDYFWALAVVWTSPLVAALGVSLSIPIAMLEDMLIHGQQYSVIYMIGSAQGVYKSYQHPFAVAYLTTSLLVVHLPFAFIKDWLRNILRHRSSKSCNGVEAVDMSSREPDSGARGNTRYEHYVLLSDKECAIDICAKEEDNAETLKQDEKLTSKEVAAVVFCIAPFWFLTEVRLTYVLVLGLHICINITKVGVNVAIFIFYTVSNKCCTFSSERC